MAKQVCFECGPVKIKAPNMTAARDTAIPVIGKALSRLDSYANLVHQSGMVSVVFAYVMESGAVEYGYTNPRTLAEIGQGVDLVRRVGCGAGYASATDAGSAAVSHILQNLPEIPADLPDYLNDHDRELLCTLRAARVPVAA